MESIVIQQPLLASQIHSAHVGTASFWFQSFSLSGRNEKGASEMNIPPISQLDMGNTYLYCKVKGPGGKNTLSLTSDLTLRPGPRNEQPNPDLTPSSEKSLSLLHLYSASMAKECFLLYRTFQPSSLHMLPKPYKTVPSVCLFAVSLSLRDGCRAVLLPAKSLVWGLLHAVTSWYSVASNCQDALVRGNPYICLASHSWQGPTLVYLTSLVGQYRSLSIRSQKPCISWHFLAIVPQFVCLLSTVEEED